MFSTFTSATERERAFLGEYLFNILFRKNLFVQQSAPSAQLHYDKKCFGSWDIFSCSCSAKFCKRTYLGTYLSENSGLFRFVSKQFCLFRLFRYRFETPKQPKQKFFWFHETNRNKRETDLVSVCFGSNRKIFLFVSRTP